MDATIKCPHCSNDVKLAKKKANLTHLPYKKETCEKCLKDISYTFCECGELIYS